MSSSRDAIRAHPYLYLPPRKHFRLGGMTPCGQRNATAAARLGMQTCSQDCYEYSSTTPHEAYVSRQGATRGKQRSVPQVLGDELASDYSLPRHLPPYPAIRIAHGRLIRPIFIYSISHTALFDSDRSSTNLTHPHAMSDTFLRLPAICPHPSPRPRPGPRGHHLPRPHPALPTHLPVPRPMTLRINPRTIHIIPHHRPDIRQIQLHTRRLIPH